MALTPKQRLPFVQYLSADAARTSILLLDYECPARDRVAVKILDMQNPAAIAHLAKSAPKFDLTEDWRRCWGTTSLVPSKHLRYVMPVIALFPRGWSDPQVMTCIFTLHSPTPGEESKLAKPLTGRPHVRWLHRF
ncbi:hypothetical protein FIBSPDRAFT_135642 [Athelia psychrophila]|uniref:Uncharacterized protein n=1 Tax=Athelia psychrophila TaxID=1759441 RepID=A0A166C6P0_9AGAM|nr:hypothetical protein FIBSPDRAFT_135642 [Fibularhizoctonia sp. CBS 109695]